MQRPKLFIFGIDGGDWGVIEPLLDAGFLPNLAALKERSACARMTCTRPAHTAPGWAALLTASYPGKNGIYQFFHTQDVAYRARVTLSSDFAVPQVWDWLEDQGWTSCVVNVPMTHPPRHRRGAQITWPLANTLRFCDPPGILGEMARDGVHFKSDLATMFRGDLGYIDEAIDNIAQRVKGVRYLLERHPCDALMVVLTEVDRVCHHYWHFSDDAHPRALGDAPDAHRAAITRCYEAVDRALGDLLKCVDESATVVVVSDHGSGSGHHDVSLNAALREGGLLRTRARSSGEGDVASWFVDGTVEVDWDRTSAYCPVPGSFGINVNRASRQRHGTVAPADFERVLRDVEAILAGLRGPNGAKLSARLMRAEEAYPGAEARSAPDLLIVPDDERINLTAQVGGPVWRPSYQTGLHRFEGIWMQTSARVRPGFRQAPMRIVDVIPTALDDIGASWPSWVDGRVDESATLGSTLESGDDTPRYADSAVADRLRAMGYL